MQPLPPITPGGTAYFEKRSEPADAAERREGELFVDYAARTLESFEERPADSFDKFLTVLFLRGIQFKQCTFRNREELKRVMKEVLDGASREELKELLPGPLSELPLRLSESGGMVAKSLEQLYDELFCSSSQEPFFLENIKNRSEKAGFLGSFTSRVDLAIQGYKLQETEFSGPLRQPLTEREIEVLEESLNSKKNFFSAVPFNSDFCKVNELLTRTFPLSLGAAGSYQKRLLQEKLRIPEHQAKWIMDSCRQQSERKIRVKRSLYYLDRRNRALKELDIVAIGRYWVVDPKIRDRFPTYRLRRKLKGKLWLSKCELLANKPYFLPGPTLTLKDRSARR